MFRQRKFFLIQLNVLLCLYYACTEVSCFGPMEAGTKALKGQMSPKQSIPGPVSSKLPVAPSIKPPTLPLNTIPLLTQEAGCLASNMLDPKAGMNSGMDPDASRDTVQLIESRGFKAETHHVTTKDGYILTVHRIRNPYLKTAKKNRVIILNHGFLSSSRDNIVNAPGEDVTEADTVDICDPKAKGQKVGNNLGFVLSKLGFDVWMLNARGNSYSQNHTKLSTLNPEFWKFTFDHIARYDLPANIQYILKTTGEKTLSYIGFSEGGFTGLAILSLMPEYVDIIKPVIVMAPGYAQLARKMAFGLLQSIPYPSGDLFLNVSGPVLPVYVNPLLVSLCRGKAATACVNLIASLTGCNAKQTNASRYHVYFRDFPNESSIWNFVHYLQIRTSETNEMMFFDYGAPENMRKYGQAKPPKYDFGKITSKYIAILHGANDFMVPQESIKLLREALKVKLLDDYLVPDPKWHHADFLYAKDLGKLALSRIVKILQKALC